MAQAEKPKQSKSKPAASDAKKAKAIARLAVQVKKLNVALVIGTARKKIVDEKGQVTEHVMRVYYETDERPVPTSELAKLKSGNYLALCPFHGDRELGSFIITPQKNMWWCFAENIGWNVIDFEKRYYELPSEDFAILHLARRFSLLSDWDKKLFKEELQSIESGEAIETFQPSFVETEEKNEEEVKEVIVPDEIKTFAYEMLRRAFRLSAADKKHLQKERHIPEEDLGDYLTMPRKNVDVAHLVYIEAGTVIAMKMYGRPLYSLKGYEIRAMETHPMLVGLKNYLKYIPGFYETGGRFEFKTIDGIGFFVRNRYGGIKGIHVRRRVRPKVTEGKKKKESRYKWLSSKFAIGKPGYSGGATPNSPLGVLAPKGVDIDRDTHISVYITEGRFKAEAIKQEGCICIYLAGVSSWHSQLEEIEDVIGARNEVYLVFDADLMYNTTVYKQLHGISKTLQERHPGFKVNLLLWPVAKGKGFDDLVYNNGSPYLKLLRKRSFDSFENYVYIPCFKETLAPYGKRFKKLTAAELKSFEEELQKKIEAVMF